MDANDNLDYCFGTDQAWVSKKASEFPDAPAGRFLTTVMQAESLVILSGSGSSLALNEDAPSTAPSMDDLWKACSSIADFEDVKKIANYVAPAYGDDIELLLSLCQMLQGVNPAEKIENFVAAAEKTIAKKCSFVSHSTSLGIHETLLRKVVRRRPNQPRTKIFTTNYDRCFEEAASRLGYTLIDGLSFVAPYAFDGQHFDYDIVTRQHVEDTMQLVSTVVHLYKVHGSVDWEESGNRIVRTINPDKPVMVYPRLGKFEESYRQPYFEMMARFISQMRRPNVGLIVTGFGFHDDHISQPVVQAIRSNPGLKCVIADPDMKEDYSSDDREALRLADALTKEGDQRILLLKLGFKDLVGLLPELGSQTESDQHRELLLKHDSKP